MKKHFTAHLIFAVTAFASQPVWAVGFGRAVSDAVLGQTLTFTVPVRVDPDERFSGDCVSVDVYFGESRVAPNAVRTSVDPGTSDTEWLVRIRTLAPIDEPIVGVTLSAGCGRRFERRFTAFADPPTLAAPAQVQRADGGVSVSSSPAASSRSVATPLAPLAPLAEAARGGAGSRAAARAARHASAAAGHPRNIVRKGPTLALANELSARAEGASRRAAQGAAPAGTARLVLDGGYAHLKLDLEDPVVPPPSAASGAASGGESFDFDDADTRQLRALEQSIQAMKRAEQADRQTTARLQAQLAEAQQSRSQGEALPYVLGGLLALAIAAAAGLAWRLRQQSRLHARGAWFNESRLNSRLPDLPDVHAAPAVPEPSAEATPSVSGKVVPEPPRADPNDAPGAGVVADIGSNTQALDRAALAGAMAQDPSTPRELSVEELLDLEQQADFFIALGQEDAAVDLLMSHLRSAGGQSPLPYTKLLEIYKRQDDRSAYERTRARFNRRFNAYAPDWDTGPAAGRSLDEYPETIARLQSVWHAPIDAMAALESLLFKRDDSSELFDLPAYRDVLLLYSLVRDLWQQDGGGVGTQVDVLLPLDDDSDFDPFEPQKPFSAPFGNDLDVTLESDAPTRFGATGFEHVGARDGLDLQVPTVAPQRPADLDEHVVDLDVPDIDLPGEDTSRPGGDSVHATLDSLSLAPLEPRRPPGSPLDWDEPTTKPGDDPRFPGKR